MARHSQTRRDFLRNAGVATLSALAASHPRVVVGENRTFRGEEDLLRSRGVAVEVLQDPRCQELMAQFIRAHPSLWAEDIGT